jgi:hypothetical protein
LFVKVKLLVIIVIVAESLIEVAIGGREGYPEGGNSLSSFGKWLCSSRI